MEFGNPQTYNDPVILLQECGSLMMASSEKSSGKASGEAEAGSLSVARSVMVDGNRIDSRNLFAASRELMIIHGDETYRLRLTAQNKLILTK